VDHMLGECLFVKRLGLSQISALVCILSGEEFLQRLRTHHDYVRELIVIRREGRRCPATRLNDCVPCRSGSVGGASRAMLKRQFGNLLSLVQDVFGIFSPGYSVREHAKRSRRR